MPLFSTERIGDCIRQKLPFANVTPTSSEDEIEVNLADVTPPIQFVRDFEVGGEEFQLTTPVGCFIRGAGTNNVLYV